MLAKTTIAGLTGLLLVGVSPVFAQSITRQEEAQAFGERLKAVAAQQNIPVSYESATISGSNVTLKGFRFGEATPETADQKADVTFQDVSGSVEEGFRAESVPFNDIDETKDGTRVRVSGMSINGLEIAGTQPSDPLPEVKKLAPIYFDAVGLASVNVEENGKQVFSLSDASVANTLADDGQLSSEFDFGTFDADLTSAPADESGVKTLRDIGYTKLGGTISGQVDWNPKDGTISLDPFTISMNDMGDLDFTYAISGYTPQFIEQLKQAQAQMAANPNDSSASGMAMMGLVSQLYLNSAVLSYEDNSLAGKLLDYFAKQNGASREAFVDQLSQMVPAMLAALNNPEFQKTVSDAVSTFLKDPQNITLSIEPQAPVPATQIIGAAMGAPQTLPNVLQLQIISNEAGGGN